MASVTTTPQLLPPNPPRDSSVRKELKKVLINYDKDGEVYLFRVDDFWQRGGEGHSYP